MSIITQLLAQLQSHNLPPPSPAWLETLLTTREPSLPLLSLFMTAKARLLASDLTSPGLLDAAKAASICFDDAILTPTLQETRLSNDVFIQLIDIENLSRSRWDQVEELEAIERGEQKRGREVVRLPAEGDEAGVSQRPMNRQTAGPAPVLSASARNTTHRLLLQDCKGRIAHAVELVRIPEISPDGLHIGAKLLLKRGTLVARGVILLEPQNLQILGGKVEAWQKAWLDGRLSWLREAARAADDS